MDDDSKARALEARRQGREAFKAANPGYDVADDGLVIHPGDVQGTTAEKKKTAAA